MRPYHPHSTELNHLDCHEIKQSSGSIAYINVVNNNDHPVWLFLYDHCFDGGAEHQEVRCHFSIFVPAKDQWTHSFTTTIDFSHAISVQAGRTDEREEQEAPFKVPVFVQVLYR